MSWWRGVLLDHVRDRWVDIFPGLPAPDRLNSLVLPSSVEGGTCCFLMFADRETTPCAVLKIYRSQRNAHFIENEKTVLSKINDPLVPQLLFSDRFIDLPYTIQSILPGVPMGAHLASDGLPKQNETQRNFKLAFDWLKTFNYGVSHGDFVRHNLLVSDDGKKLTGVIDWAYAQPDGPPADDAFFFIAQYFFQIRKRSGLEGFYEAFRQTFLEKNRYSDLVKSTLSDYLSTSDWESLFVDFLERRARFEADLLQGCLETSGLPRFAMQIVSELGISIQDAPKHNLWSLLLRLFIAFDAGLECFKIAKEGESINV